MKNKLAEMAASSQVCHRRRNTARPARSACCPSTGASRAINTPAMAVEVASALLVKLVDPNELLVR
ncbi:Uncharacterised protein [Enterobacter cloacae]|nr:Uncharacterised protein [Enterobacter cloacae]